MAIYTNSPFPRHYGSSLGHRQVVASSAPLIPVKSDVKTKESNIRNLRKVRRNSPLAQSPLLPQPLLLRPQLRQPLCPFSLLPLRRLTGLVVSLSCHRWAGRPADVCVREEIKDRLAAPLVGERLRGLRTVPAPGGARKLLGLFEDGRPQSSAGITIGGSS